MKTRSRLQGNILFEEFKGALTEQYVAQDSIYPLEVKSAENLQAKSLRVYNEKFSPPRCLRISFSPYREES